MKVCYQIYVDNEMPWSEKFKTLKEAHKHIKEIRTKDYEELGIEFSDYSIVKLTETESDEIFEVIWKG